MKDIFHAYFKPSDDDLKSLWHASLISFDANTLLNLYRYSPQSSDALIELIKTCAPRIRLPHQFAEEYSRNRPAVIMSQVKRYADAESDLLKFETEKLGSQREHPYLDEESISAIDKIKSELTSKRKSMEKMISNDPYANFLLATCAGKIGNPPTEEELVEMHREAAERFAKEVPPGYKDQTKKGLPGAYGDFIAWEQLISIATIEKNDLIVVTDDLKDDWWWSVNGRTVGPRPELLNEFSKRSGQRLWMYNSEGFLRAAELFGGADVPTGLKEEVGRQIEVTRKQVEEVRQKPTADSDFSFLKQLLATPKLATGLSGSLHEKPSSSQKPTSGQEE
ncbi:MAG TPA: PIN domain-containing protein [Xanthobacteraceae bacterium]|nr:PIN domain-containing protein [Xanthobacteraceae bacterium]